MKQQRFQKLVIIVLCLMAVALGYRNLQSGCGKYLILPGTEFENTVVVRNGKKEGRTVYIIAGIHGDESAGIQAAKKFKKLHPQSGSVYVLSPANSYGAEQEQRLTRERRDLNRNFPGDAAGCDAEQIAAAIYADIKEKQPDLVLDLHEAVSEKGKKDALGNSLICQSLQETGDLVLELLTESEKGTFGDEAFTLYGSPPPGSVNRVITEELGIPVITIETYREEKLEKRIEKQVKIVRFILAYLEIC